MGFFNIRCVNGKEAHDIREWHINKTAGTNNVLHIALTAEECISLNGDYTGLQANMRKPFWEYMIYNTCPFDSLTTLLYLFSERKIASAQLDKLRIIGFQPNTRHMVARLSKNQMSTFNRGYQILHLQHHYNKKWQYDEFAQQSVHIWEICHHNILDIFKRFSRTNGFAWDYNALTNLSDLQTATDDDTIHAAMTQVMEYLGLQILKYISAEHHNAVLHHLQTSGNASVHAHAIKDIKRVRGRQDHHTWCYMQNQEFYPEDISKMNKYRSSSQAATTGAVTSTAKRPRNV